MRFRLGAQQDLIFTEAVVATLQAARQHHASDLEAGGQLFGKIHENEVVVEFATGVRSRDHRSRTSFIPSRTAERKEIAEQHRRGRVYLGDWHTHPEPSPTPSSRDVASVSETAEQSRHLAGPVVLVVVGTAPPPTGIHVLIHDGRSMVVLAKLDDV